MKCTVIYNPESGKKDFINKLDYVVKTLAENGYDVTVEKTEKPKHAVKLAEEACKDQVDLLVVSGGDGTVHEVINGMARCKNKPKIGYIPSGTACDLASTLKIPKKVPEALQIILTGVPAKMDVAKTNKGYFMYVTAIGTYVDISYVTDSKLKKFLGYLAYILTGIKEFFTIPMIKTKIIHDGGEFNGYFSLIMVVNSKKVAGFNIVHNPVLDDGKVDVVLYRYIPFLNNVLYFISFILSPKILPGVKRFRTSKIKILTEHHHKWNTDGEESNSGNLLVEVEEKAIDIIVKPEVIKKYFKNQ